MNIKFYTYFWIFIFGSAFGVISESIWRLVTRGVFVARLGVLYGPFNPVYGIALVIMTLILVRFSNRNILFLVLFGALFGGGFEYLASFLQEFLFGTVSWDYSKFAYNINGRVNIPYIILWGLLCTVWIKVFYPVFIDFIGKMPLKPRIFVTYVMMIFMIFNVTVSGAAVYRGSQRAQNIPAHNSVEVYLDNHYPDAFLSEIYKNMKQPHTKKLT